MCSESSLAPGARKNEGRASEMNEKRRRRLPSGDAAITLSRMGDRGGRSSEPLRCSRELYELLRAMFFFEKKEKRPLGRKELRCLDMSSAPGATEGDGAGIGGLGKKRRILESRRNCCSRMRERWR